MLLGLSALRTLHFISYVCLWTILCCRLPLSAYHWKSSKWLLWTSTNLQVITEFMQSWTAFLQGIEVLQVCFLSSIFKSKPGSSYAQLVHSGVCVCADYCEITLAQLYALLINLNPTNQASLWYSVSNLGCPLWGIFPRCHVFYLCQPLCSH